MTLWLAYHPASFVACPFCAHTKSEARALAKVLWRYPRRLPAGTVFRRLS